MVVVIVAIGVVGFLRVHPPGSGSSAVVVVGSNTATVTDVTATAATVTAGTSAHTVGGGAVGITIVATVSVVGIKSTVIIFVTVLIGIRLALVVSERHTVPIRGAAFWEMQEKSSRAQSAAAAAYFGSGVVTAHVQPNRCQPSTGAHFSHNLREPLSRFKLLATVE